MGYSNFIVSNLKEESISIQRVYAMYIAFSQERAAELFKRAARNVRLLVRLLGSMANNSIEMTLRSATEEQWHMLNTSEQAKELAFNKDIFAKRRVCVLNVKFCYVWQIP